MAITNGYATQAQVKAALGIGDSDDDTALDRAVEAASRLIDGWCGRVFYDVGAGTRYYTAQSRYLLIFQGEPEDVDVQTVTTLKADAGGDGTFETTWTEGTHFQLEPHNASTNSRPFTRARAMPNSGRTFPLTPRGIEVVGTFGWAAVPDEVEEACIIQSSRIFKRVAEAPFGVAAVGFDGSGIRIGSQLDADVKMLLNRWRRVDI